MRLAVVKVAILLSIFFFATCHEPALAQRNAASRLGGKANQAYEKGDYLEALRLYRLAEEAAKTAAFTNIEWSHGYLGMAETLRSLGQYAEAEKYFKVALQYSQQVPLAQNTTMSTILNDMGQLYRDQGRNKEAETYWKQSELLGGYLFLPINNLARLYLEWGKFDEAKLYVVRAAALSKTMPTKKTFGLPYAYFNIGFLAQLTGQYALAEQSYKEMVRTAIQVVGKKHLYYALSLSGLANLYTKQSRFTEAEALLREALAAQQSILPEDHPDILNIKVALAAVLRDEGRYAEAEEIAVKVLKAQETLYGGQENIFNARTKSVIGTIKRQNGQYDEAAELLQSALSTAQTALGRNSFEVAQFMRDLARVKLDQGKFQDSENLLKDSLSIVDNMAGPDHPERAATARDLGYLYLRQDRFGEAEPQFKKALELAERVLGQNAVTADSARDLGNLYLKQKKFEQAQEYLKKALSIDEKLYGENAPQIAADLLSLANVLDSQKQSVQAAPLVERANSIRAKLPGAAAAAAVVEQPTIEVPVSFAGTADRPVRDKWALAIGVSNFKDPSINLKYAAKDATDFSNFLVAKQHFKADHVKLLTNEQATRQNIIEMLGDKWLGKLAQKDDLVLVYVSSHGSSSMDNAGGVNFLVAHDTNKESLLATGIPMQWLTKMIKDQVHSDRVIVVLDVCHSGSAAGGKALGRIAGMAPQELTIGTGQMVLCSSLAEQISWESKNYENSVFTRRLIEALETNQDKTTMLEAYRQLKFLVESEVLRDRSNLQTPVLWNKEWIGKDPILAIEPTNAGSQ